MAGGPIDHLAANVAWWQGRRAEQVALARRQWATAEPSWGVFGVPESVARILPADVEGADVVELGCGTAYVSAWLARRGARPVGLDPTPGQLAIARQCQAEFGLGFPLVRGAAEQVPLADGRFDLAISEYGAAIWADPHRWIPEAARLLRPGGRLVFLGNSALLMLCVPDEDGSPATDRLVRDHFGMYRLEWPDEPEVEFHLGHGDWIRLFRSSGFEVEDLIELRPGPGTDSSYPFVTAAWARRWPCEEAWVVRRR
jgi:SAM-dependent methyltransferase